MGNWLRKANDDAPNGQVIRMTAAESRVADATPGLLAPHLRPAGGTFQHATEFFDVATPKLG